MISAKVIADTKDPASGVRITTLECTMHRFILAEFNTHRKFSRNSASSRAIPILKRIRAVLFDIAMPVNWGSKKPGMQAGEELPRWKKAICRGAWRAASWYACLFAYGLYLLGLHKQVANRLLEPFLWHTVVVTSTEWENFFSQRVSPLAQPEMRELAVCIHKALLSSSPEEKPIHTPYVNRDDVQMAVQMGYGGGRHPRVLASLLSASRCAAVSYGSRSKMELAQTIKKDMDRAAKLLSANPPHWSPFEHTARVNNPAIASGNLDPPWEQMRSALCVDKGVLLRACIKIAERRNESSEEQG